MRSKSRRLLLVLLVLVLFSATPGFAVSVHRIHGVSFGDSTHGFMSGVSDGGAGLVSSTFDGGLSWRAQRVPDSPMIALSASGSSGSSVSRYGRGVYETTNGLTWNWDLFAAGLGGAEQFDVAYLAGDRIATVGLDKGNNGKVGLIAFRSGDAWTASYRGPIYAPATDEHPIPQTNAWAAAIDTFGIGQVAWTAVNEHTLNTTTGSFSRAFFLKTTDAGSTWTTQTVTATYALVDVAAVSSTVAYATGGQNSVYRTLNGGSTWTKLDANAVWTANGKVHFVPTAIEAIDQNTVVVVGQDGRILKSGNASQAVPTWTRLAAGKTTQPLRGVAAIDTDNWIVVGDDETRLRTNDAGATWTGTTGLLAPAVTLTEPAAGFSLGAGAVTVSGTAADSGIGVQRVEIRARRADGASWNGSSWVMQDTWLPVTDADSFGTWSTQWTPDSDLLISGQLVTIAVRAVDGLGLVTTSAGVTSGVGGGGPSPSGAIIIAGGASHTAATTVPVAISSANVTQMRWCVNGGAFTAWEPVASSKNVPVPAGDGLKTVLFQFTDDGATPDAMGVDTITLDQTLPTLGMTSPVAGFSFADAAITAEGTASDGGSGLDTVTVRITRGGQYWNGAGWQATSLWLPATGAATWSYTWSVPSADQTSYLPVKIEARATDAAGNVSAIDSATSIDPIDPSVVVVSTPSSSGMKYAAPQAISGTLKVGGVGAVSKQVRLYTSTTGTTFTASSLTNTTGTGGAFTFSVNPKTKTYYRVKYEGDATSLGHMSPTGPTFTPAAYLTTPALSVSSPLRNRGFTISGWLGPKHAAGSPAVTLTFQRYERQSNGTYKYVTRKTATAKISNLSTQTYSKYAAYTSVPSAGRWRVYAKHADSSHYATASGSRSFTAR